jgi:hypothetical protein
MKERERKTAERFGVLEKVEKLEKELLAIAGVAEVDFDLDGFYDNMNRVTVLTKYDIPVGSLTYFAQRKALLDNVARVAKENELFSSGDSIEEHGEWFYFARVCGQSWRKAVANKHKERLDISREMWKLAIEVWKRFYPNQDAPACGYVLNDAWFLLKNHIRIIFKDSHIDTVQAKETILSMINESEYCEKILSAISWNDILQSIKETEVQERD